MCDEPGFGPDNKSVTPAFAAGATWKRKTVCHGWETLCANDKTSTHIASTRSCSIFRPDLYWDSSSEFSATINAVSFDLSYDPTACQKISLNGAWRLAPLNKHLPLVTISYEHLLAKCIERPLEFFNRARLADIGDHTLPLCPDAWEGRNMYLTIL